MSLKRCTICDKMFKSSTGNAKYCSLECRERGRKDKRKEWEQANPDYDKNRMKEYRKRV